MTRRDTPEDWQGLQQAVAAVWAADGYAVEIEKSIPTARGVVNFDVYAQKSVGGHKVTLVAECKHWKKNVPQGVVHAFRTQVDDLGADAGYVISSSGFQSGAFEAIKNTSVRLATWDQFLELFEPEGPPLAPGLRASAQITSGTLTFHGADGNTLPWMGSKVTGGLIRRGAGGGLLVWVETEAVLPALQEGNVSAGWKGLELRSTSSSLSADPTNPTVLTGVSEFTTVPGMVGLHPVTGEKMTIPQSVGARLEVSAEGCCDRGLLKGTWSITAYTTLAPMAVPLRGTFCLQVL